MASLNRIVLSSFRSADTFVRKTDVEHNGYLVRWAGWDLETFIPDPRAFTSAKGIYDREVGAWGFKHTFPVSHKGSWTVFVPKATK